MPVKDTFRVSQGCPLFTGFTVRWLCVFEIWLLIILTSKISWDTVAIYICVCELLVIIGVHNNHVFYFQKKRKIQEGLRQTLKQATRSIVVKKKVLMLSLSLSPTPPPSHTHPHTPVTSSYQAITDMMAFVRLKTYNSVCNYCKVHCKRPPPLKHKIIQKVGGGLLLGILPNAYSFSAISIWHLN